MVNVNFVIQGGEFRVDVGIDDPVDKDIKEALKEAKVGETSDGWTARTESGKTLDGAKTLKEQGVTKPDKIFLNKGPGRGGWAYQS